jgi:DHA1 family tetracycline resistance protein-like MFS transporter
MMICLTACMALQMTSFVIILPLFARRFSEFGAGVGALGISDMAYALAATVAAPLMGALADRLGRRPLVLGSLAVYVLAFTGYLLASSTSAFILLRGLAGALTAGLIPAATGMVADLAPENRRGQWIGILSGGASFGWIAGPILGGLLYDRWGFAGALLVAIGMATLAFTTALLGVRETRSRGAQQAVASRPRGAAVRPANPKSTLRAFRATLPVSLTPLGLVLSIYFAVMFAWAFSEPRFMFYAYDDLGWSSSMLGLVMSTYGIAMMLGEFGLSRLSDDLGRKRVIAVGLVLFSAQFIGLALSRNYMVIALAFVIAGLGNALFDPALSASVLDIAPTEHQTRILGLKSTAGSLGNIAGPALIVLFTPLWNAQGIFLGAAGVVLLTTLVGFLVNMGPQSFKLALRRRLLNGRAD